MDMHEHEKLIDDAIEQARSWQIRANDLLTKEEKNLQQRMKRLLNNPMDKVILTKMIDRSFRSSSTRRVADQIYHLMKMHGVPEFFSIHEKMLMHVFLDVGRHFHPVSVPKVINKIRADSNRSVAPGEKDPFLERLHERKEEGVTMNINHIGEVVQGEQEAESRLTTYVNDLENPDIEYISVKISTIYSQIQSLAFEQSVQEIVERLARLFRVAKSNVYNRKDGTQRPKFVNLDMEEYRDLHITATAFTRTLDRDEFKDHSAGIVLQAYIPDSYDMQKAITEWAKDRVAKGGAPIKLRIVKGANMEMEYIESALHNWPLAPYDNKLDVDSNYKRMVEYGLDPKNIEAVHLGIASHNLFELAYAYKMAQRNGVAESTYFTFEMLEGMADHIRRAITETAGEVVVYAPVATKDQFINAIAYLVRRLDENTGEENFLRYSFGLEPDSTEWNFLKNQFIDSCMNKENVRKKPYRIQDRSAESFPEKMGTFYDAEFYNEPDTDWSILANLGWADAIRKKWRKKPDGEYDIIPLVIDGQDLFQGRDVRQCYDPSQYHDKVCVGSYALANAEDVERAVMVAKTDPHGWRKTTLEQRHEILSKVAGKLRRYRGDLIGAAAAETGKVFTEADPEVSEAIDFAEFYPYSAKTFDGLKNIRCQGKGVGVVITPWNFPIAIPCGGLASSLAAGNTVIFKPASAAVLTAWRLCQAFWDAGISKKVLQFLPCSGNEVGSKLTLHPDVDFIIFTGGTGTGLSILKQRPNVLLAAETGGKNATIVTAMSDRDQAIKNVLHSAFGNCGQKCSATSLLVLEKEVYNDPNFKKHLVDAANSFMVGSAWNFQNKMGPMIQPPKGDLKNALTKLEAGESWALEPKNIDDNPYLWSPGIKWGVKPGGYTHMTEFFGPVLAVMCADDLDHAIDIVNQTGYGLTSGIESLDEDECQRWKEKIYAGNLYINRGTTGAIVLRQPFGGYGKSALGAGIKAGGLNYVSQFMDFQETGWPSIGAIQKDYAYLRMVERWRRKMIWGQFPEFEKDIRMTIRAVKSYLYQWENKFSQDRDYFHLRGQDNIIRYLPVGKVVIRIHEDDALFDILARIAAAKISLCEPIISIPMGLETPAIAFLNSREGSVFKGETPILRQKDEDLAGMIPRIDRIRYAAPERTPYHLFEKAAETGFYISRAKVMMEGAIELIHYHKEQSVCHTYHRYGNLGERALLE